MNKQEQKYADIIHLSRPQSAHRKMTGLERAAQFSPFAALTGHAEALAETARLTCTRPELSEDEQEILNRRLQEAMQYAGTDMAFTCTYFVPDEQKEGGAFVQKTGSIRKLDEAEHALIFADQTAVPVACILSIDGRIFRQEE